MKCDGDLGRDEANRVAWGLVSTTGAELVEAILSNPPDCVVLDLQPGVIGFDVRELSAETAQHSPRSSSPETIRPRPHPCLDRRGGRVSGQAR